MIGEFEEVLDDTDDDNEIDDITYIATLHEYNDPSDPNSLSDDPWLRTKTTQVNKGTITEYEYTARGNVKRVLDAQQNETLIKHVEEDSTAAPLLVTNFPDLVTEVRRPAPDLDNAPNVFYPPTKFSYDSSNGNLLSVEDADGETSYFRYNSVGQVNRVIDRRGFKTYMIYDSRARLEEVHVQKSLVPSPSVTEFANEVAADFRSLIMSYDIYDNLLGVEDSNGDTVDMLYDSVDRPTKVTDGNDAEHVFQYLDKVLKQVTLPDNNVPSVNGRLSTIDYDSAGRPISVNREDSSTPSEMRVGFGYDGFSQMRALKRIKNGAIKSHTADYDRQGRSTKSTDPDLRSSTVAYEPYCVGMATTSARGVRQKTSFDTLCRLTEIEVGDSAANPLEVANTRETRKLHYDDLGRLTQTDQITGSSSGSGAVYGQAVYGQSTYGQTSGGGTTTESRFYEFDALDRLKKVTFEDGKEMSYLHDKEGNVIQMTEDASSATPKVTQFSYFGDGRLYEVTYVRSGGDQVFTYSYDPGGRPLTLTYPALTGIVAHFSGPNSEIGWDGNGQLKHLRYMKGSATVRRFEYSYDDAGNRVSQLDVTDVGTPRAVKWEYGYDFVDRLETVKKAEAANVASLGALQLVSVYEYDAADNRIKFEVPDLNPALTEVFTYEYSDSDDIESIFKAVGAGSPSLVESLTSDADGNLLTRVSGGVTTTFSWTDFNRLKSISTSDNSKKQDNTFGVNGFRRKKKDKNDVETTEYAAGLATAVAKSTANTITYLMGHQLMGFEQDGMMYFFISDAISTTRDVVNSSGAVVQSYEFDEWGNHLAGSGSGSGDSSKTYVGGFSVQDEVADTGLFLQGHRWMDPTIGRFISRDPIGFAGGMNLFEASKSNPNTLTDHTGLSPDFRTIPETQFFVQVLNSLGQTESTSKISIEGVMKLSGANPLLDLIIKGENLLPVKDRIFVFVTVGRPINPSGPGASFTLEGQRGSGYSTDLCSKRNKDTMQTTFASRMVKPEFELDPFESDQGRLTIAIPSSYLYGGEGDILIELRVLAPDAVKFTEGKTKNNYSPRDVDLYLRVHRQNATQ